MKIGFGSSVLLAASLLLLAADWLAFHDYNEPHTVRDWLMLLGSMLVFFQSAKLGWKGMDAGR